MIEKNGIINLDLTENTYCIYILNSSVSTDKTIYIGLTKDATNRWKQHARSINDSGYFVNTELYDWMKDVIENKKEKIYFSVIENNLEEKEAIKKEIFYIENYKINGYNLLNKTNGGKGTLGLTHTERVKEKMSKSAKGLIRYNKKVFVKNIQTNEISSFLSQRDCSITMNISKTTINNRCNKKNLTPYRQKYIFSNKETDLT